MTTHRTAMLLIALLSLACSGCGPDEHKPIPDAALYYEANGGPGGDPLLYCPAADAQIIVPAAEPGQPYEPLAAWCSWSCARYAPEHPEPGSLILLLERTGEINVQYWEDCH